MATPSEKLASSLATLKALQDRGGVAIQSGDLLRSHRERLLETGFLREVMKGWYITARPDEPAGESTGWYASYWAFCAAYLAKRFDRAWSLSPEQSLLLHAGNRAVPRQLLVRAPGARNRATPLAQGTSVFDLRASLPDEADVVERDGLRLFSIPAALVGSSPNIFHTNPVDVRTVLAGIGDSSAILALLLAAGRTTVAGRLAGAFRNIGRRRIADDILAAMHAGGYTLREQDPFAEKLVSVLPRRDSSPWASRIRLLWQAMRGPVLDRFPVPPGRPNDIAAYLARVQEAYVTDAYHSLSIEGYRVDHALIERVRSGSWNPDLDERDREQRDALAARGYWLAYQAVQQSIGRVLSGLDPGAVADEDHGAWYRQMFAPGVAVGLLKPTDLAGYRNTPVYIRHSRHVPPDPSGVRDAMPALFEMLAEEVQPAVRVILGHFMFVYIHPYPDGNGRIGRFLMNVMLAAGGYPWVVVPVDRRDTYMAALEDASVRQDIVPFVDFVGRLVDRNLRQGAVATGPGC